VAVLKRKKFVSLTVSFIVRRRLFLHLRESFKHAKSAKAHAFATLMLAIKFKIKNSYTFKRNYGLSMDMRFQNHIRRALTFWNVRRQYEMPRVKKMLTSFLKKVIGKI
jgi:hypothetical protein